MNDAEMRPRATFIRLSGGSIFCIAGLIRLICKPWCEKVIPSPRLALTLLNGLYREASSILTSVLMCRQMWSRCQSGRQL